MAYQPYQAKALLLPADGSNIRPVEHNSKEGNDEGVVDSDLAEFYDPIPDLKPWLQSVYPDILRRNYHDPTARAFIKQDRSAARRQLSVINRSSSSITVV